MSNDIYLNLLQILRRDSKDTTYKYALLRGLIELSSENPHHLKPNGAYITTPMGLMVEKWVHYYWPLIEADFPQKHGDNATRSIAFRKTFKLLTDEYQKKGGYPQFRHDYHSQHLSTGATKLYLDLLKVLRTTIAHMPMKHLGQSVHHELYHVVKKPSLPTIPQLPQSGLTPQWVVQHFGFYDLRLEYHEAFQKVGDLLLGTDAILYHWADFTARLMKDPATPSDFEKVFHALNQTFEAPRVVQDARDCYENAENLSKIKCTWCDKALTKAQIVIDHVLPYSQTQNNELWNLLPACQKCNGSKSDSIPAPALIEAKRGRIIENWGMTRALYPQAFQQEVQYSLTGYDAAKDGDEQALKSLSDRCAFLIAERGYDSWVKT
jgi:hypothetical protein